MMKIEHLAEGAADCPLIRIFGTSVSEFLTLRSAIVTLVNGQSAAVEVHALPGFHAVNGEKLTLIVSDGDSGIEQRGPLSFWWMLPRQKWDDVAALIQPFTASACVLAGHQWLCGREASWGLNDSQIALVLSSSASGQW
jgi:hypothetical protein